MEHPHTYLFIYMSTYIYIYIYIYIYKVTYVCIYTYINTHIHMHITHVHIQRALYQITNTTTRITISEINKKYTPVDPQNLSRFSVCRGERSHGLPFFCVDVPGRVVCGACRVMDFTNQCASCVFCVGRVVFFAGSLCDSAGCSVFPLPTEHSTWIYRSHWVLCLACRPYYRNSCRFSKAVLREYA